MNYNPSGCTDEKELDVAIAHWHVNSWGGAEYLVSKMATALDIKEVYTLGEPTPDRENPYSDVDFKNISPELDFPLLRRVQRKIGRVFEYAQWEDVDWREHGDPDVVISSGATTRAVITPDDTLHLNYCHSTPRWFYDLYHDRKKSHTGRIVRPLIRHLRTRDMAVDPRTDHYFVNSPIIKRRLWKYYKRDSEVLYPPVEIEKYYNERDTGFFLYIGRLDNEKGVPEIVDAFHQVTDKLIMVGGEGDIDERTFKRIKRASNIEWRGFVTEDEKIDLLSKCSAVVFNGQNEDFGIVPIEANASGKPVLARNDGFPAVHVKEGQNGYLHDGTSSGIREAINQFKSGELTVNPSEFVSEMSYSSFEKQLKNSVQSAYEEMQEHVRQ